MDQPHSEKAYNLSLMIVHVPVFPFELSWSTMLYRLNKNQKFSIIFAAVHFGDSHFTQIEISSINYLIKCWKNVISKLNFCNRCCTCCCQSNCKANYALFTQRSVENTLITCNFSLHYYKRNADSVLLSSYMSNIGCWYNQLDSTWN